MKYEWLKSEPTHLQDLIQSFRHCYFHSVSARY